MNSKQWSKIEIEKLMSLRLDGLTWSEISSAMGISANCARKAFYRYGRDDAKPHGSVVYFPKILIIDIETTPIISYTWGTFDQNISLNQILEDWSILSWSAKWIGSDKIFYKDTRDKKNPRDDSGLLKDIWELMNDADIICGQNSQRFDVKKLNARFILNGLKPPSSYRQIDTLKLAKKHFAFTSNKLEYMSKKLCTSHKKLDHKEFSGFELWKECLSGNKKAFNELEKYNIEDVLSTEELYQKLAPWDSGINLNVYDENYDTICSCGSKTFHSNGFVYTNLSKMKRFTCTKCGKEHVDKTNLLSKEKRKTLKK